MSNTGQKSYWEKQPISPRICQYSATSSLFPLSNVEKRGRPAGRDFITTDGIIMMVRANISKEEFEYELPTSSLPAKKKKKF